MGRTREFDIDQALLIAADLFWRKGYDGTSVSDLTVAMGITAPSFYFAFGSKDGLFEKIIADYQKLHMRIVEDALNRKTANQVVRTLLSGYIDLLTEPGRAPGCLIMNSSLPVVDDHPFRKRFAEERKAFRRSLQKRLKQALNENDKLPVESDPAALAHLLSILIWGLAVEAQSGATRASLHKAISAIVPLAQ